MHISAKWKEHMRMFCASPSESPELIMDISVIRETDLQKWDEHVGIFSGSPLISTPWLESFRTSDHTPVYFRFAHKGDTVGLIAGLVTEPPNPVLKKLDRSILFFSGPAVAGSDKELARACIIKILEYATVNRFTSLKIRGEDCPYVYDLGVLPYRHVREEYIIDLREDLSQKKVNRMIKRKVRKARENRVTFHETRSPEFAYVLASLLDETEAIRNSKGYDNYIKFAIPFFDEKVICKLLMNKLARIFYAKKQDKILCTLLTISHAGRACAMLIGTNQEGYELGANALVYYCAIEKLKEEGNKIINLGPVANDSGKNGLIFFKTSLGAEKHTCLGGTSSFLQGPFLNLLYQVYYRFYRNADKLR